MNEDNERTIQIFATQNYADFQIAKTLLSNNGINFWSNGESHAYVLAGSPYTFEIRVFEKDFVNAKKVLSNLL